MHTKTKTNTKPLQTMGSTLNNRLTTTEPRLRTDSGRYYKVLERTAAVTTKS